MEKLTGVFSALPTPFRDGHVDYQALDRMIDFQISHGINGLLAVGTTGESATLDYDEHYEIISRTIARAEQRVPVIAGAGSNNTREAVTNVKRVHELGADFALIISPYYNRPTQEGLYAHFSAVADAAPIPNIIYNVPTRTGTNIEVETVSRLAKHGNIIGIKEASGNLRQISSIISSCPDDFCLYSGDDETNLFAYACGAVGSISVLSNVAPGQCLALYDSYQNNNIQDARQIHFHLLPLCRALFSETNPIPVKAALAMMGIMSDECRLPLQSLAARFQLQLETELIKAGII